MNPIRPQTLDQYVGQQTAKKILGVLIAAAKKRNEPVPHLLMSGPAGLGKTTLSRIVANEMGGRLIEVLASAVKSPAEIAERLMGLRERDILFIDEIHALGRACEEQLYSAMEDGTVAMSQRNYDQLMKQIGIRTSGGDSKSMHRLPRFTLIGASTMIGKCSAPLRSRFAQVLELEPYTIEELQMIVTTTARKLQFDLPQDVAREIAVRSRSTARVAVGHVTWYQAYILADGEVPTMEALHAAFRLKGIDSSGLTRSDRQYLACLAESEEPLGLDTVAATLAESTETLEQGIEPFLLRQGMIQRTARGRVVTARGRQALAEVA